MRIKRDGSDQDAAAAVPAVSTMTTTTTSTSLSTFLHRDIDREGHRVILPFLDTDDRLWLSECSKGLVKYRHHLSRVKVVPHPSPTPMMKKALDQLLLDQEPRSLEYLCVGHESVLHVLDLSSLGCYEGLKTLAITAMNTKSGDEDVGYIERALSGGGLESLEELSLRSCNMSPTNINKILAVLKDGVCPGLQRLDLSYNYVFDKTAVVGIGQAMARLLESGHCHNLRELGLGCAHFGEGGVEAIANALQGGACPELLKVNLASCHLSTAHARALGAALKSGACPKLEELNLTGENDDISDEGWTPIMEAIEWGSCPNFKRLGLGFSSLGIKAATSLGPCLILRQLPSTPIP